MLKRIVFGIFSIVFIVGCSNSTESPTPIIEQNEDMPAGEESVDEQPSNEISFELNGLAYAQILHDKENHLVYFFTSGLTDDPNEFRLVSFDYKEKTVVQEVRIDPFFKIGDATLHGLGTNNGKPEVYIASLTSISIRDGLTLEELDNFTVPDATRVHCVQQIDNKIYVTYTNDNDNVLPIDEEKFVVFDRNTFEFVSEVPFFEVHAATFALVRDYNDPNQINCLTTSNFSSRGDRRIFIHNFIFEENGDYKDSQVIWGWDGDKRPIRTNSNAKIMLSGRQAKITDRSDTNRTVQDNAYLASEIVADYEFSPDGNSIYIITERDVVKKINSSDLSEELTIPLNRPLQEFLIHGQDFNNIIVSDDELIILDYKRIPSEERHEVTLSFFPR